jgi:ABC-type branched-subunit amino acid transport system substrate-binding protein
MTTSTMLRRLAVLVAALSLLAAGCRSSDTAGGGGASEEDTAAASEPEPESESEEESEPESEAESEGSESESEPAAGGEIATDIGVTEEPCPDAVNPDHGCIYLGSISDLTVGPFSALGPAITAAQEAFWNRVNEDGGIGDAYDVNVTEYVRDNLYAPETHNQVYQEIKGEVLALAQTLGSPTTAAIIEDLNAEQIVAAPASWTSLWAFQDVILESGSNYCIEAMNAVDYTQENQGPVESVMAVHYPGDYGGDYAAGARIAAEANGMTFTDVETGQGADNQGGAIQQILSAQPDLVLIATGPTELGTIVGQAAAQGFTGRFVGAGPTWNPGLVESPAFPALQQLYLQSTYWPTYTTPGIPAYEAMREALGEDGNDGFTSGWMWSYPLLAALEAAAENGDLTRAGLFEAASSLMEVDYEGALPEGSGNYAGGANESLVRGNVFQMPNPESPTGVETISVDPYIGPNAEGFDIGDSACYLAEG